MCCWVHDETCFAHVNKLHNFVISGIFGGHTHLFANMLLGLIQDCLIIFACKSTLAFLQKYIIHDHWLIFGDDVDSDFAAFVKQKFLNTQSSGAIICQRAIKRDIEIFLEHLEIWLLHYNGLRSCLIEVKQILHMEPILHFKNGQRFNFLKVIHQVISVKVCRWLEKALLAIIGKAGNFLKWPIRLVRVVFTGTFPDLKFLVQDPDALVFAT